MNEHNGKEKWRICYFSKILFESGNSLGISMPYENLKTMTIAATLAIQLTMHAEFP